MHAVQPNRATPVLAHFGPDHPLAEVAARHCAEHAAPRRATHVDRVACGPCWELAIRDDERVVVECDLPRELTPNPDYVDEIAVELACRGERTPLTPVELAEAVRVLRSRGLTWNAVARRLHVSDGTAKATTSVPGEAAA